MGSGQGEDSQPDAQRSEDRPARRSALPTASLHARRGRGLAARGSHPLSNRQAQVPHSAPPAKGQGQRQHSPGGRRHASPAPASREVGRQLSPTRSHSGGRGWMGGARAGLDGRGREPLSSTLRRSASPDPEGRSPGGGGESVWSPASCCRRGVRLGCRQRPFQNRSEHTPGSEYLDSALHPTSQPAQGERHLERGASDPV